MAFPKTQSGTDPMLEAPSPPDPSQYEELGLRFVGRRRRARSRPDRDLARPARPPVGAVPARAPRCAGAFCIAFSGIFYLWSRCQSVDRRRSSAACTGCRCSCSSAWFEQREFGPLRRADDRACRRSPASSSLGDPHRSGTTWSTTSARGSRRCWATPGRHRRRSLAWLLLGERPSPGGPDRPADHAGRRRPHLRRHRRRCRTARTRRSASRSGSLRRCVYAGYLLVMRRRRVRDRAARPARCAVATIVMRARRRLFGAAAGNLDLVPSLPAHAYLLLPTASPASRSATCSSQVSLPRLPAVLRRRHPAGPAGHDGRPVAMVLLGETPSPAS